MATASCGMIAELHARGCDGRHIQMFVDRVREKVAERARPRQLQARVRLPLAFSIGALEAVFLACVSLSRLDEPAATLTGS